MTRTEELVKKANALCNDPKNDCKSTEDLCFIMGKWADENPNERMIAKYLYEKKGYPIDLNGHLPSFEETMKDVEKYNKYKEDKLIEKARELLARMVWEVTYEDLEGNSVQHYDKMEFIEDFCKAMKGE